MCLCVVLDNCIFICMADYDEALKHNRFTALEKDPIYNKRCITLILQYRDDISLSHLYFHLSSARENTYACS